MVKKWFACDRCGLDIKAEETTTFGGIPITTGFYRRYNADGTDYIWARFFRGIEELVCHECIWADEKFQEEYPHMQDYKIRQKISTGPTGRYA